MVEPMKTFLMLGMVMDAHIPCRQGTTRRFAFISFHHHEDIEQLLRTKPEILFGGLVVNLEQGRCPSSTNLLSVDADDRKKPFANPHRKSPGLSGGACYSA